MQRVTLRIPEQQIEEVDDRVDRGEFPTRSEAIRTALRELLTDDRPQGRPLYVQQPPNTTNRRQSWRQP